MEEEYDQIHLQAEAMGLGLIDFSSENDALVLGESSSTTTSTQSHQHNQLLELGEFDLMGSTSMDTGKEVDAVESNDQFEKFPALVESSEPEIAILKGKCNLRKSLAWDRAFFTNAGVLDAEELSTIINGAEKCEKQTLHQIVEDIRESTDSVSTLGGDSLTLENLEVGLFEDIRASIQRSTPMEMGHATKNQVKPKTALRRPNMIPKPLPKQTAQPHVPMKAIKQDSQIIKPAAKTGNSTTTTTKVTGIISTGKSISTATEKRDSITTTAKATRLISSGRSISTATEKRNSVSATQGGKKGEKDMSRIGASAGADSFKAHDSSGNRRVLPKPSKSSKSSSVDLSMTKHNISRFPSDRSGSLPTHATKLPIKAASRKLDKRHVKLPSDSTLKTASRTAPNNQTATGNSALAKHVMSSKDSCSISPCSSISELSASSSSTSTTNQRSNKSRISCDTKSCSSLDNDNPQELGHHSDQILEAHEYVEIALHGQETKKCSTSSGRLLQPPSMKPTGLKMPSPSIGFFDGMKMSLFKAGEVVDNRETSFKPKTERPYCPASPDMIAESTDHGATDLRGSSSFSLDVYAGSSKGSHKKVTEAGRRTPKIHVSSDDYTNNSADSKKPSKDFAGGTIEYAQLDTENEPGLCLVALVNRDQREIGETEKQMVEINGNIGSASSKIYKMEGKSDEVEAATAFSPKTLNNCRSPLAEVNVGNSEDKFKESAPQQIKQTVLDCATPDIHVG